jgi:tRNA (cmo5U34)-methyltransferase
MAEFKDTSWVRDEFTRHYLAIADAQIPQRSRLKKLIQSFYRHYVDAGINPVILDLGSGDGVMTESLLDTDPDISPILVDASAEMTGRAKLRLAGFPKARFITTTFRDLVKTPDTIPLCDLVISSLAVHHISTDEKKELFRFINGKLKKGSWFLLYDSVLPPTVILEEWYIKLWIEWIRQQKEKRGIQEDMEEFVFSHHQEPSHHESLDTLDIHLDLLRTEGFSHVDIIYKYGIFSLLCGQKTE